MTSCISSLFAFLFLAATACDWVNTVIFEESIVSKQHNKHSRPVLVGGEGKRSTIGDQIVTRSPAKGERTLTMLTR